MKTWQRVALIVAGILLIPLVVFLAGASNGWSPRPKTLIIGPRALPLTIEIANSEAERQQGLSDRVSMAPDHGMLFDFDEPYPYPFWMQRMHFPLDIIFLRDGVIVDIAYNLPPPASATDTPVTYTPKQPADRVLELNAGRAKAYDLRVGLRVPELP